MNAGLRGGVRGWCHGRVKVEGVRVGSVQDGVGDGGFMGWWEGVVVVGWEARE